MNEIQGILIEPADSCLTFVSLPNDAKLEFMQSYLQCQYIDRIVIDNHNDLWIDDEFLFNNQNPLFYWNNQPLGGRGLILGYNELGQSINTTLTLNSAGKQIDFTNDTIGKYRLVQNLLTDVTIIETDDAKRTRIENDEIFMKLNASQILLSNYGSIWSALCRDDLSAALMLCANNNLLIAITALGYMYICDSKS